MAETPVGVVEASPLVITAVEPTQSCGGEWSVQMGPTGEGTLVALLGTDEDYEISLIPGGSTVSRLSNCTLTVAVQAAEGVSYALTRVAFEGHASLDSGVAAEQSVAYNFAGGALSERLVQHFDGPYEGSITFEQPFTPDRLIWSSCDAPRPLQIRTSLFLGDETATRNGALSMSLAPGVMMLVLDFATRPCASPRD
jgi:hypothetical protein